MAMVTPSFVIVGAPHDLANTTLRPLRPNVTLTVSASALMPARSSRRAVSLKASCFAQGYSVPFVAAAAKGSWCERGAWSATGTDAEWARRKSVGDSE